MAGIIIQSRNLTRRVDAPRKRTLTIRCAGSGHVQRSNGAVSSPEEAVDCLVRIIELASDLVARANTSRNGALTGGCARTRGLKGNDFGFTLWFGLRLRYCNRTDGYKQRHNRQKSENKRHGRPPGPASLLRRSFLVNSR